MLIIRADQVAALDAAMLASFRRRLLGHLRTLFPEQTAAWGEERTLAAITDAEARAASFGIVAERDVARFTDLVVGLGPEFPDQPDTAWTRPVLEDRRIAPGERVDRLFARLAVQLPQLASLWRAWE